VVVSEHVNLAPEIEKYGAGWVTSLDAEKFSNTLMEALQDEAECYRRGGAGRELVLQRFSWNEVATQLLNLYENVKSR
jgi:glycosyltransferase involved in cell wall biosynthesis